MHLDKRVNEQSFCGCFLPFGYVLQIMIARHFYANVCLKFEWLDAFLTVLQQREAECEASKCWQTDFYVQTKKKVFIKWKIKLYFLGKYVLRRVEKCENLAFLYQHLLIIPFCHHKLINPPTQKQCAADVASSGFIANIFQLIRAHIKRNKLQLQ